MMKEIASVTGPFALVVTFSPCIVRHQLVKIQVIREEQTSVKVCQCVDLSLGVRDWLLLGVGV